MSDHSFDLIATEQLIKQHAHRYLGCDPATSVSLSGQRFAVKSTYPLFRYTLASGDKQLDLVVKFAPVEDGFNEGQIEFSNMRMMATRLAAENTLGSVNAIDFIEATNALVMEYIDCERLSEWFLQRNRFFASNDDKQQLQNGIFSIGRWLQVFHDTTRSTDIALQNCSLTAELDVLQERLQQRQLLQGILEPSIQFCKKLIRQHGDLPVPQGFIHGDYGPQNMGMSGNKLFVFDLQRNFHAPVFQDLAYFLVTLATLNPYPKHFLFDRRAALALGDDFLRGYGLTLSENNLLLLNLFYLKHLLQRCLKQYNNQRKTALPEAAIRLLLKRDFSAKIRQAIIRLGGPHGI